MQPEEAKQVDQGVSYFAARNVVLFAQSPFAKVKLCRLAFGTDGSIYVSFPYLREKRGILSKLGSPATAGPVTYDLREKGVVVPVDVKFSHHTSGQVGFSRTGLNEPLPRQTGFPLTSGEGVVFQLHIHWLHGFTWLDEPRAKDLHLGFTFPDEHPFGLRVEAHWWRKEQIARHTFGSTGQPPGPRVEAINRQTGRPRYFLFIGQPPDLPLRQHILAVTIEPTSVPDGADTPGMIFFGGFSQDAQSKQSSALAFLYPVAGDVMPTVSS